MLGIKPPRGYNEIVMQFGDIAGLVGDDGRISAADQATYLTTMTLPFTMAYAYDLNITIRKMTCHKLMVPIFGKVFADILQAGFEHLCHEFGGCYVFRPMRGSSRLSTHSWGIAVDINPRTNLMGTDGDMAPEVVAMFKVNGFTWGGDFKRKDPMHFQYCSGY